MLKKLQWALKDIFKRTYCEFVEAQHVHDAHLGDAAGKQVWPLHRQSSDNQILPHFAPLPQGAYLIDGGCDQQACVAGVDSACSRSAAPLT